MINSSGTTSGSHQQSLVRVWSWPDPRHITVVAPGTASQNIFAAVIHMFCSCAESRSSSVS